jgi:hypothetical protein
MLLKENFNNGKNVDPCRNPYNRCRLRWKNQNIPTIKHLYVFLGLVPLNFFNLKVELFNNQAFFHELNLQVSQCLQSSHIFNNKF